MHHVWLFLREFEVRTTFALLFVIRGSVCLRAHHHRRKRNIFWSPTKTRREKQTVLEEEGEFFFSFLGGVLCFFIFSEMKEGKDTPPRYLFLSGFALK